MKLLEQQSISKHLCLNVAPINLVYEKGRLDSFQAAPFQVKFL